MPRNLWGSVVVLALLGGAVEAAQAQETFTPVFKAPYRSFEQHEFGASVSDPGEGVDYAMEGFYSYGKDKNDFGLRAGFAQIGGGSTRLGLPRTSGCDSAGSRSTPSRNRRTRCWVTVLCPASRSGSGCQSAGRPKAEVEL